MLGRSIAAGILAAAGFCYSAVAGEIVREVARVLIRGIEPPARIGYVPWGRFSGLQGSDSNGPVAYRGHKGAHRMSDQIKGAVSNRSLTRMTAKITAAYVAKNSVKPSELGGVISSIVTALRSVEAGEKGDGRAPAVPINRSVRKRHIICLEDGRKMKTLKRHIQRAHGMTPDEYRAKWGLTSTYPMVAPDYAALRSKLLKFIDFGRKQTPSKRRRRKKTSP